MDFAVETWAPEYQGTADSAQMDQSAATVDPFPERPASGWSPIDPHPTTSLDTICFVDGIRNIDARIWVRHEGTSHAGACASVAAGVVHCTSDSAEIEAMSVFRGVFAQPEGAGPIATKHGCYQLVPLPSSSPDAIYLGIHNQMTMLEEEISSKACNGAGGDAPGLVVFDGPLRSRNAANCVGFIKTHSVQYLPNEQHVVVGSLAAGQRTPLFLIGSPGSTRWGWYLRLPGPMAHDMSGIVRCELPGLGTVDAAAERADEISSVLPRYASAPHKDPRAPQNLYPIRGLEDQLRRRLGDREILERSLRLAGAHN
jgi:hypothetical protein